MTTAGEVVATIREMADNAGSVLMDVSEFFSGLPDDLDLASAAHYLNKEFKRNDRGIDDRGVEIYTYADSDYDDYSDYSGYDDEDDWYGDEYDF